MAFVLVVVYIRVGILLLNPQQLVAQLWSHHPGQAQVGILLECFLFSQHFAGKRLYLASDLVCGRGCVCVWRCLWWLAGLE